MLLPEPISTGLVLSWVISGRVGNSAHTGIERLLRGGVSWMRGLEGLPANHDVARAVRMAQMDALECLIDAHANPGGHDPKLAALTTTKFVHPLRKFCQTERARAQERNFVLVRAGRVALERLTHVIDGILAPRAHAGPPTGGVADLATGAEDAVLDELRAALRAASPPPPAPPLTLPADFEALFRGRDGKDGSYLAVFGGFIAERLKTDSRFQVVFNTGQLAQLLSEVAGVALDVAAIVRLLEDRFGGALGALQSMVTELRLEVQARQQEILAGQEELKEQVGEGFASVHDGLAGLKDEMSRLVRELSAKNDVSPEMLQAILAIMGEHSVPVSQAAARLRVKAADFVEFRAQWMRAAAADIPVVAQVRGEALRRINAGDFDGARPLLVEARRRWNEAQVTDRIKATGVARLLADEAWIDKLQMHPRAAADHYAEAAMSVNFDPELQAEYLDLQAEMLYYHGRAHNDNAALTEAVRVWREHARLRPQKQAPFSWAVVQRRLGLVLFSLGMRESGTGWLEQAIAAYRNALAEYIRERVPLDELHTELADALLALGLREAGTDRLQEAVAAYRAAHDARTRRRVPGRWALAQTSLGNALLALGEREASTSRIEEAIVAYGSALEVPSNHWSSPNALVRTQVALVHAIEVLAERAPNELDTAGLESVIKSLDETLTEDLMPLSEAGFANFAVLRQHAEAALVRARRLLSNQPEAGRS